jgi:hypothetical protein
MPHRELRHLVESGGSNGGLFGDGLRPGKKYTAMIEGKRYIAEVMDRPSADADTGTGKPERDYGTIAPGRPRFQEEDDVDDGNDPLDTLAECIGRLQQVHQALRPGHRGRGEHADPAARGRAGPARLPAGARQAPAGPL